MTKARRDANSLPKGLFWRGKTLWVNRTIDGRRHQFSTKSRNVDDGLAVYESFLAEHGLAPEWPQQATPEKPALPKGLYWRGNVIWLSRKVDGRHHNVSTGTSDPELAEQFLADFNLKAFKGEAFGIATKRRVTFSALADRYIDQGETNGLRPRTLARYRAVRDHFDDFLASRGMDESDARLFDAALIEDYKTWRASCPTNRNGSPVATRDHADRIGAAPRTIQIEVQSISTFYRYARRIGLVDDNPTENAPPVRVHKHAPIFLDTKEIEQLLSAATTFDSWSSTREQLGQIVHDVFLTYLKTGMRLDELRHLEWTDVDLAEGMIHIRDRKTIQCPASLPIPKRATSQLIELGDRWDSLPPKKKAALIGGKLPAYVDYAAISHGDLDLEDGTVRVEHSTTWNPKTKGRIIPISPALTTVLAGQERSGSLVFPDPKTGGLWRFKTNRLIKACVEHAGINKNVHTHTLRHTFATQLRRRGVALETIKELLGHSDLRDTLIYAHFTPEEARAAVERIDFF